MCCAASLALWAFVIEPNRLVLRETQITLPAWPASFKGFRIAVISDLHAGRPHIMIDKLRRVVEMINAAQPDLVVMPGDFVEPAFGWGFIEPEAIASELKGLRARFGVFAALGNHDWWYNGSRVTKALENVGIRVLENDAAKIELNAEAIWLVGVGDMWEGTPNIASALAKVPRMVNGIAPVIAFTHNPDIFPSIPSGVSLTIAGHTHGGQVRLPIIGRPLVPSAFGERYAAGHIVEGGKNLFVTSGIGTSILPVRFRVPPEISLLTIN
jgi:predicted MPP superfamily phosphohydrolase